MAKGIELKYKGGPYGDECSEYEFETFTIMTIKEFLETIAADKKEWGYIRTNYFGDLIAEYSHGEITYHIDCVDKLIDLHGFAYGGWSRMDYVIKII